MSVHMKKLHNNQITFIRIHIKRLKTNVRNELTGC